MLRAEFESGVGSPELRASEFSLSAIGAVPSDSLTHNPDGTGRRSRHEHSGRVALRPSWRPAALMGLQDLRLHARRDSLSRGGCRDSKRESFCATSSSSPPTAESVPGANAVEVPPKELRRRSSGRMGCEQEVVDG